MLRDTAVSLVKGRLARFTSSTVLDDHIVAEMKAYQEVLETAAFLPWFLVKESSSTTLTVSDDRLVLPSDFLRETEADALWITDSDGNEHKLDKDDYDEIRALYPASSLPKAYDLVGDYLRVRPIPDAAYTVKMIYFGRALPLDDNIENGWLKHASGLMIAGTGYVIASQYVKNKDAAAAFAKQEQRAHAGLLTADQARKDANREYRDED